MLAQHPRDVSAFLGCRSIQKRNPKLKAHVLHPDGRLNGNFPRVRGSEFYKYLDFGERVDSVKLSGLARLLGYLILSQLTIFSNSKETPSRKPVISRTTTWNNAQIERKVSLGHDQTWSVETAFWRSRESFSRKSRKDSSELSCRNKMTKLVSSLSSLGKYRTSAYGKIGSALCCSQR